MKTGNSFIISKDAHCCHQPTRFCSLLNFVCDTCVIMCWDEERPFLCWYFSFDVLHLHRQTFFAYDHKLTSWHWQGFILFSSLNLSHFFLHRLFFSPPPVVCIFFTRILLKYKFRYLPESVGVVLIGRWWTIFFFSFNLFGLYFMQSPCLYHGKFTEIWMI